VFDIYGRVLSTKNLSIISRGSHEVKVDVENLKAGTYIMQVVINGQSTTSKFMIVK
jgi:hypothetical protein